MTPANSINAQIDDRGRGGGMPLVAAAVNRDHRSEQHKIAGISSHRQWRGSKARLNCRAHRGPAFLFTPRTIVLREISELRTRRLSGAAALIINPLHHVLADFSDAAEPHSNSLSSVCVPDGSTAIGMAFANEQKDTAAGVKSD